MFSTDKIPTNIINLSKKVKKTKKQKNNSLCGSALERWPHKHEAPVQFPSIPSSSLGGKQNKKHKWKKKEICIPVLFSKSAWRSSMLTKRSSTESLFKQWAQDTSKTLMLYVWLNCRDCNPCILLQPPLSLGKHINQNTH